MKGKNKRKGRLYLPNGCACSYPSVYPSNWDKAKADINKEWYIQYYFYDPELEKRYPNGRFIRVKQGINTFYTLKERRMAVKVVMKQLLHQLQVEGLNPNTGRSVIGDNNAVYIISPDEPLISALRKSLDRKEISNRTKQCLVSTLKYCDVAFKALGYDYLPVSEVNRKHIRVVLDYLSDTRKNWTDNMYNNYKRDLSMLFDELVQVDAINTNPALLIHKKKVTRKKRTLLTEDERIKIAGHLIENDMEDFLRFLYIFYNSGSRIVELMRIKREDVSIKERKFRITIKKGGHSRTVFKPIMQSSLPYWTELYDMALPEQYLFSEGLIPGYKAIDPSQVTKRWYRNIKKKLGIDADLYSLKHLNLTETLDNMALRQIDMNERALTELTGHTSLKMLTEVYDFNYHKRRADIIKDIDNPFA